MPDLFDRYLNLQFFPFIFLSFHFTTVNIARCYLSAARPANSIDLCLESRMDLASANLRIRVSTRPTPSPLGRRLKYDIGRSQARYHGNGWTGFSAGPPSFPTGGCIVAWDNSNQVCTLAYTHNYRDSHRVFDGWVWRRGDGAETALLCGWLLRCRKKEITLTGRNVWRLPYLLSSARNLFLTGSRYGIYMNLSANPKSLMPKS